MSLPATTIQYQFVLPSTTKHTSYSYQKLFRAIYGYTQNVTKNSGKVYRYHRRGVVSTTPYIHIGKNKIIIPKEDTEPIIEFFKTGQNPTHNWRGKGDWKATYYVDNTTITEEQATKALEAALDRCYIKTKKEAPQKLLEKLKNLQHQKEAEDNTTTNKTLKEAKHIVNCSWFNECCSKSAKLQNLNNLYNSIKPSNNP